MEADVEKDMVERREITLQPTEQSMEEELVSVQGGPLWNTQNAYSTIRVIQHKTWLI